jgi:hypothetical protein
MIQILGIATNAPLVAFLIVRRKKNANIPPTH